MTANLDNQVRDLTTEELDLVCGGTKPTVHFEVDLGNMKIVGHASANGDSQGFAIANGGNDVWVHGSPA